MDDLDAPRVPANIAGKAIAKVADRLLAYRALAVHLRQGVRVEDAMAYLREEIVIPDDDKADADVLARLQLVAALQAIQDCFSKGSADRPFARVMSDASILLTIEERAIFALPVSKATDLADLFETAAVALASRKP